MKTIYEKRMFFVSMIEAEILSVTCGHREFYTDIRIESSKLNIYQVQLFSTV